MKKFLSLVLALIMVMSLVTVGAGATFTDAEEITNTEAVEVMAALGILEGSNGAFDPQGTLTRGAAAKIITYILAGQAKAEAIKAAGVAEPSFSDVPATSANAAFIEYCAQKGVVGGYSDGTFRRSNPVSGNAFVKMVLVALGVDDIDFTAKGWQIDAIARAEEMGLLEGIDTDTVVFSANLTRENAAQIAFNALLYVPEGSVDGYKVVILTATPSNALAAMAGEVFDSRSDAIITMNAMATAAGKTWTYGSQYTVVENEDATASLGYKNYKLAVSTVAQVVSTPETVVDQDTTIIGGVEYDIAASKELVGHFAVVYYKDANGDGEYLEPTSTKAGETVYSIVTLSDEVTVKKTTGLKYTEVNEMLGTKITKAEAATIATQTGTEDGAAVYGNVIETAFTVTNYDDSFGGAATVVSYENKPTYSGLTVAAGTYIVYENVVVGVKKTTSSVDAYTVAVDEDGYYTVVKNGSTTIVNVEEDEDNCYNKVLNEIDWLALIEEDEDEATVAFTTKMTGEYYTLGEVKTVTGAVTKIDTSASTKYVYIDGTKYTINTSTYTKAYEALGATKLPTAMDSINEDYDVFYLDAAGKVFAYGAEDGSTTVDGTVIIPIRVYSKVVEIEDEKDEYGDSIYEAGETGFFYTIWVQAVNAEGEIVNLQVQKTTACSELATNATIAKTEAETAASTYATEKSLVTGGDLNKVFTYTTTVDSDTEETIAAPEKVTGSDTKAHDRYRGGEVKDTAKKIVAGDSVSYYLNDSFKVIYISGNGSNVEITVKNGAGSLIETNAIVYGEKEETDSAYDLKLVVIDGTASTSVAGTEIVYVKGAFNTNVPVKYVDEDEKSQTAYEQTVYVDGEKTTILASITGEKFMDAANVPAEIAAGFYTYEVDEYGVWALTPYNTNTVINQGISIYKGLLTAGSAEDVDVTGAKVVNLLSSSSDMGYDDVPTNAAKLVAEGTTVSFVYDDDTDTVAVIYVTAYADQD